ncbi:MAG: hypothetical protein N3G20_10635 [Verrucomicrobiae bacterium]|nr:hypothetical protein [Verrucomicrobiae bacterium]
MAWPWLAAPNGMDTRSSPAAGRWLLWILFAISMRIATGFAAQPEPGLHIDYIDRDNSRVTLGWTDPWGKQAYTVQIWDGNGAPFWLVPRASVPWPISEPTWQDSCVCEPKRFYRVIAVPKTDRGRLLQNVFLGSYTAFQINIALWMAGIPLTVSHDVDVYKLLYQTIDPVGAPTFASGALVIPKSAGVTWPLLSYQHGTVARKDEAPSAVGSSEQWLGVIFAACGYVTALPDYLGLGDSPGIQLYHHASSEATAAVDMLRATRTFCATKGILLNNQLFLAGYSQGGHATMALHRELEEYHSREFGLTASAPMAGAYDLSGVTTEDALSGRPMPNPHYFALLFAGYQSVYRLSASLADILAPPYDTLLPPLLDGYHSGSEINSIMPRDITKVLRPDYLERLRRDPNHPLRLALKDNDLYRWTPRAPMRLYHCAGDSDVIFANSQVALACFHARGATHVTLVDPNSSAGHGSCAQPAFLMAKRWFDSFRN